MVYMRVLLNSQSQLRLLREPTILSKAVFIGFCVGVLGIFFYGSESFFFKVLIGICAGFLSCFIVDSYELCELNKEKSEVKLTRLHWFQYLLNKFIQHSTKPYVTARLGDIRDVRVEEQQEGQSGQAYQVVLVLDTGIHLGVTEVYTTDKISEHEKIVEVIRQFLGMIPSLGGTGKLLQDEADYEGDGSASEDDEDDEDEEDDFEQISQADLEALKEEEEAAAAANTSLVGGTEAKAAGDAAHEAAVEEVKKAESTEPVLS